MLRRAILQSRMLPVIVLSLFVGSLASGATWTLPGFKSQTTSLLIYNGGEATTTLRLEILGKPTILEVAVAAKQSWDGAAVVSTGFESITELSVLRVTADQPLVILAKESGVALPVFAMDEISEEGALLQALWLRSGEGGSAVAELAVLAAGTRFDIVLFDAMGRSQGSSTFTANVGLLNVDLTALLAAAPTARRAELRLLAGRLAGGIILSSEAAGRQRYPFSSEGSGAGQLWFTQVKRGAAFRIFNTSTQLAKVKVTAEATSFGETLPVDFDMASGEHLEVADALSAWFAAPDDGAAMLRIQSNRPLLVLATKNGPPEEAVAETFFATTPGAYWVPSFDTSTLFPVFSADRATKADLIVRTLDGELLGQASAELEPWSKLEVNLPEAIQVELPERVNVEVFVKQGVLQAKAELRLQPYQCPLPDLELSLSQSFFSALPQPVQIEAFWSTSGADRVLLEDAELASTGSKMFPVTATRNFTLRATNSCGTAVAMRSVLVGPPAVTGLQSTRPLVPGALVTAQPGERLVLNFGAAVPFDTITAFSVSATGAKTRWVSAEQTEAGQIAFTVPLLPIGQVDSVYSGPAEVRMVVDEATGAPFRFQIAPLTYQGDAVADFRKWFENYVTWSAARRTDLLTTVNGTKYLSFLAPTMDVEVTALRAALTQIAATGRAVIGVDQPSLAYPVPSNVAVTKKSLELFMALKARLSERTDREPAGFLNQYRRA